MTRARARSVAGWWAAAAAAVGAGGWLLLGSPGQAVKPSTAASAVRAVRPAVHAAPASAAATPAATDSSRPSPPGQPTRCPSAARATPAQQVDELAGRLTDAQLQQLLEHATPSTVSAATAAATTKTAWEWLQQDLTASGWTKPHRQAAVARATTAGDPPAVVDVTILWSGTSSAGEATERRRNVVRLARHSGSWRRLRIT